MKWFGTVVFCSALIMPASITQAQDLNVLKSGVVRIKNTKTEDVGAGFILKIDKDGLYVITASHVVRLTNTAELYLYDRQNEPLTATVIHREGDEDKGLALLMLKTNEDLFPRVTAVSLAHPMELKGGEPVEVIGFPDGSSFWTVTSGSISRVEGRNLIFAAPIRSGNSGGPVFFKGHVIGLVAEVLSEANYAVPAASISQYVNGIVAKLVESADTENNKNKKHELLITGLRDPRWNWRSVESLSAMADVSEAEALDILKRDSNVKIGKLKDGRLGACLKARCP